MGRVFLKKTKLARVRAAFLLGDSTRGLRPRGKANRKPARTIRPSIMISTTTKWRPFPNRPSLSPPTPPKPLSISSFHAAGTMSLSAIASAAAASTSLSSVNPRRSSPASRVPVPLRLSLPWRPLSSSSSSHSLLRPVSAMASPRTAAGEAASRKKLIIFDAEEDLASSLAKRTAELSARFAAERGAFTVVLSGGSLVKALRKLTEPPYLEAVDWSKWHVFWVDERVVPKDQADSNYKLTSDEFLSKVPIPAGQVYAINDALSAEGAAEDYETRLRQLVKDGVIGMSPVTGFPKFDLMLMGMGPDGHVASLFPGHPVVHENQKWVTFVKDSPKPPPERITFTLPVINSSACIALVVTGAGKAGAVHKALSEEQNTSDLLPVEMVSLQDGELTWFTDKPAVSMLSSL